MIMYEKYYRIKALYAIYTYRPYIACLGKPERRYAICIHSSFCPGCRSAGINASYTYMTPKMGPMPVLCEEQKVQTMFEAQVMRKCSDRR